MDFEQFNEEYNRLYKEEDNLYHRLAKHFGLSDSAFWILYTLESARQPLTQTELRGYLSLSKQTINSALKQLEQEGHLRLSSGSRRNKYIHLTETGQALAGRTVRPVLKLEERAFLGMAEEERASILALHRQRLELLLRQSEQIFSMS